MPSGLLLRVRQAERVLALSEADLVAADATVTPDSSAAVANVSKVRFFIFAISSSEWTLPMENVTAPPVLGVISFKMGQLRRHFRCLVFLSGI